MFSHTGICIAVDIVDNRYCYILNVLQLTLRCSLVCQFLTESKLLSVVNSFDFPLCIFLVNGSYCVASCSVFVNEKMWDFIVV